jgi:hypothetical protein
MGQSFDPYHKWLGIPAEYQPANHYRLLGVTEFEADPDVLQAAADQRMAHLRTYQTGRYADWSQRLLNEVAAAKICLLTPAKKAAYDEQLRQSLTPQIAPLPAPDSMFEFGDSHARPRLSAHLHRKRPLPTGWIVAAVALGMTLVMGAVLLYSHSPPPEVDSVQTGHQTLEGVAKNPQPEESASHDDRAAEASPSTKPKSSDKNDVPDKEEVSVKKNIPDKLVPRPDAPTGLFSAVDTEEAADADRQQDVSRELRPDDRSVKPAATSDRRADETEGPVADERPRPIAEQGEQEADSPRRVALPSVEAREEAMKQARETYRDELAKAKAPEDKLRLVQTLREQSRIAKQADADLFCVLHLAKDLAIQAADTETALAMVDQMSDRYQVNVLKMKAEALAALAKKPRTTHQHVVLAEQAVQLADEATSDDDHGLALSLTKFALTEATAARNKELILALKAGLPEIQRKAKLAADSLAARDVLADEPYDPAANTTVGIAHVLLRGDWKQALPHLAEGDDPKVRNLAQRELNSPPAEGDARVALADAWWEAAQAADTWKRLVLLRHARTWYAAAQSQSLSEPDRARIEKRLEELAAAESEAAGGHPKPRVSVRISKWFSLLSSPNELTGWDVKDCRFSYVNRVIMLQDREMLCPIIAKDASLRVKVGRRGSPRLRLILRDGDRGCYIAQLSSSDWSILKRTRNPLPGNAATARTTERGVETVLNRLPVTRTRGDAIFMMAFAATGDTLTILFNNQAVLQAKDTAFTEGMIGLGTENAGSLSLTDVELFIPKGSFVADHRSSANSVNPSSLKP